MKFLLSISICLLAGAVAGQGFYDLDKIQDIRIYFSQPDWDYRMDTAKAGADGYLLADSVVVNGAAFKNCGVKYKGNSSYDAARAKNPPHIELDYQEDTDYQGFTDIKLGNCWSDNSSVREPLTYAILRQYMDAPRGNFARVSINGAFYGLMNNAESIGKAFLRDRFASAGNAFVKCNPLSIGSGLGNGPNLGYLGPNVADYASKYELKSDTGWAELIGLCDTLDNHFEHFAAIADVDRFLWMLAFNNATVNLDSYTGAFRQNYYLYRADNGHWMPVVWDLNMCIGGFAVAGTTDPNGQLEDWIELYNNSAADINLTGLFLSDNPDKLPKWPFPDGTTIPANGYLIAWADEDNSQPGLHANFKLKASGESVALATSDGRVLDSISFGAQLPDRSFGRFANGTGNFTEMPTTFAAENQSTSTAGDLPGNAVAFRVFPNPANGWARVATEKHLPEAEIRLLDAQGRRVWSQRFQNFERTDLPVSGLPPGLYAVCVFSSGGPVGTAKIVVE
ncbi:MAG: CotH kinase family protein [Saprospiraceae bacterium]